MTTKLSALTEFACKRFIPNDRELDVSFNYHKIHDLALTTCVLRGKVAIKLAALCGAYLRRRRTEGNPGKGPMRFPSTSKSDI